jgi:hypothetical protein
LKSYGLHQEIENARIEVDEAHKECEEQFRKMKALEATFKEAQTEWRAAERKKIGSAAKWMSCREKAVEVTEGLLRMLCEKETLEAAKRENAALAFKKEEQKAADGVRRGKEAVALLSSFADEEQPDAGAQEAGAEDDGVCGGKEAVALLSGFADEYEEMEDAAVEGTPEVEAVEGGSGGEDIDISDAPISPENVRLPESLTVDPARIPVPEDELDWSDTEL